jgi:hypothetical protein
MREWNLWMGKNATIGNCQVNQTMASDDDFELIYGNLIREYLLHDFGPFATAAIKSLSWLNPDAKPDQLGRVAKMMRRRAEQGPEFQRVLDELNNDSGSVQRVVVSHLMPNLAARGDGVVAPPVTLADLKQTRQTLSQTEFTLEEENETAICHVLDAIARDCGMDFAVVSQPSEDVIRDSCERPTEFAMANDTLTEDNLFLVGSNCQQHQVKGVSIRLRGDYHATMLDEERK